MLHLSTSIVALIAIIAFSSTRLAAQGKETPTYEYEAVAVTASGELFVPALPDSAETEFITVLNSVRSDPASFLPAIDKYERYVKSFTKDKKALEKALREIRKRLKSQSPLLPLATSPVLQGAADDHIGDMASSGIMGHIGSDGSDPLKRVRRFGSFIYLGECITLGYLRADLMVASMLVDEGTPDRGHRENLLKPEYTHIGVGIGSHPSLRIAAVVDLGAN
ncbi:MAG: CAP domain-containing protein [bacterium]|nr:CAP domain-containing protein [bacterium]